MFTGRLHSGSPEPADGKTKIVTKQAGESYCTEILDVMYSQLYCNVMWTVFSNTPSCDHNHQSRHCSILVYEQALRLSIPLLSPFRVMTHTLTWFWMANMTDRRKAFVVKQQQRHQLEAKKIGFESDYQRSSFNDAKTIASAQVLDQSDFHITFRSVHSIWPSLTATLYTGSIQGPKV